jgi:hypothetical protein
MSMRKTELLSISVLILCCAACSHENVSTKGLMVDVATSPRTCGDGREIIAVALRGHRARLNSEPDAAIREVARRLHEVMSYRAEKVLYVKAEADVSWGEFLEFVDQVLPEVDFVSILTPQVEELARRSDCLSPSCRVCTKLREFRPR